MSRLRSRSLSWSLFEGYRCRRPLFDRQRLWTTTSSPITADGATQARSSELPKKVTPVDGVATTGSQQSASGSSVMAVGQRFLNSASELVRTSLKPKDKLKLASTGSVLRGQCLRNRTVGLVKKVQAAQSAMSRQLRTEELCGHLNAYPAARSVAVKAGIECTLLRMARQTRDDGLRAEVRQCLALTGYVAPPRGRGLRILSIDGGGTRFDCSEPQTPQPGFRGIVALSILKALEAECGGRRLSELFDLVVGVSTGAMVGALSCASDYSIDECQHIYKKTSSWMASHTRMGGLRNLLTMNNSFYNTAGWVELIKESVGLGSCIETARKPRCPKLCFVSCLANRQRVEPFVFRNFNHPSGADSVNCGDTAPPLWQALQASAAAPVYFGEVEIGADLHHDGGVLVNNPTAIGLQEARLLWPTERLQCVVSVGTGRSTFSVEAPNSGGTSLLDKVIKLIDSATDTESTHRMMNDLLPTGVYFRFNPYMSHVFSLDEGDESKLAQMQSDAHIYLRKNQRKMEAVAACLLQPRRRRQRLADCTRAFALERFNWKL